MHEKDEQFNDDVEYTESEEETDLQKLRAQLKRMRNDLKSCSEERQEYLTLLQRSRADIVNERREHAKNAESAIFRAHEQMLHELLPVLDSFDMAFANKALWEKVDKNWRSGIEHIYSNFLSILERYNLSINDPQGEKFDPTRHESIELVDVFDESKDNIILEVLQKGYLQNVSVVRPAKVKVGAYKERK